MCGIVGYIGNKPATGYLLDGLESLEYRGYDSAGIALLRNDKIEVTKVVGRVEALRKEVGSGMTSACGIGHTRWATHGGVLEKNAHPHLSQNGEFAVVHNGIIENYQEIKDFLIKKGYKFISDTDTEVVPNLIDFHYRQLKDVNAAFLTAIKLLRGAYAIVMTSVHDNKSIYAAKLSSPLAIGVGDNEMFIGSDGIPMAGKTDQIVFLQDNEAAVVTSDEYEILNLNDDSVINRAPETLEIELASADLGAYDDYMSKEIHEAPQTVRSAMLGRARIEDSIVKLGGLESVDNQFAYITRIIIIACGTSYYAGMVGEYLLEEIAGIPVEVQQASEFRYRKEPLSRSTAVLVISQSGETADCIAALNKLKGTGVLLLGVVNAPGSTLARLTDAGVYCHAGPEKAVASTKAFVAQVTVLCLIALHLSKAYPDYKKTLEAMDKLPAQLEQVLKLDSQIKKIAVKYSIARDFLFIGRRYLYPVALEGALKLKEISYIHAEGFAGGEMKHGPLALVDENFPTFALALSSDIAEKSASNMQEIKSRGGPIIAVVDDAKSEAAKLADDTIVIPKTIEPLQPALAAVVTYLFAYHVARKLDRDIDKPRNLAKSVTVE
ncbi:MAG: glutamine--fructose-6-phosphate transaminase (isomerizing) [bacterium]|nr:glutamine--fructose-6-phosphate transaminase (isomerizing) [bacterium]